MQESVVRVGIMSEVTISFELHGNYSTPGSEKIFNGKYNAELNSRSIQISDGKGVSLENRQVEFRPADFAGSYFILKDVTIGIDFHWEQKEDQRFRGSLTLLQSENSILAINTLPIEEYLISVISSEMSATSSPELLKAHSVISRSWLIAQIEKSEEVKKTDGEYNTIIENDNEILKWYGREDHSLFDVCADDHCQRYQGITKAYTNEVENAVTQTQGLVLTYDDKICDTRFSKSCGGISEAFENTWEPVRHPYLTKVIDGEKDLEEYDSDLTNEAEADKWIRSNPPAFCNTNDKKILSQVLLDYDQETTDFFRWRIEYSQQEVRNLIESKSGIIFGNIMDLIPVERGVSGRLIRLRIVGSEKILTVGKELEIRKLLSTSHLYSSAFVVEKEEIKDGIPQKFILTGAGWGHGVGLCQIGAAVMAEKGYSYKDILMHYFWGAQLSLH